jgi:hypothetical protein
MQRNCTRRLCKVKMSCCVSSMFLSRCLMKLAELELGACFGWRCSDDRWSGQAYGPCHGCMLRPGAYAILISCYRLTHMVFRGTQPFPLMLGLRCAPLPQSLGLDGECDSTTSSWRYLRCYGPRALRGPCMTKGEAEREQEVERRQM